MNFIETGEINKRGIHGKSYDTNKPLSVDDIISIIKGYEDENTKLFECRCSTFSESGNTMDRNYRRVEQLDAMHRLPNPSISVRAIFVDPRDMSYKFTIGMAANTRGMNYFYSEDTVEYVRYKHEIDEMQREAAEKKRNQEQLANSDFKK